MLMPSDMWRQYESWLIIEGLFIFITILTFIDDKFKPKGMSSRLMWICKFNCNDFSLSGFKINQWHIKIMKCNLRCRHFIVVVRCCIGHWMNALHATDIAYTQCVTTLQPAICRELTKTEMLNENGKISALCRCVCVCECVNLPLYRDPLSMTALYADWLVVFLLNVSVSWVWVCVCACTSVNVKKRMYKRIGKSTLNA